MDLFFLSHTPLFHGIREEEIEALLPCLHANVKTFEKDDIIFHAGTSIHEIGLVLTGGVNIIVPTYWGNNVIFGHIAPGALFGENYAALPGQELLGDVVAAENTTILLLDMQSIMTTCRKNCRFHHQLIHNLLRIAAQKSLHLSHRMMHIAPKTLREKLLSYLSAQAQLQASAHFTIPFNRQQLAEYLGVDRSALSNALSKMKREGLLSYHKNEFILKRK